MGLACDGAGGCGGDDDDNDDSSGDGSVGSFAGINSNDLAELLSVCVAGGVEQRVRRHV